VKAVGYTLDALIAEVGAHDLVRDVTFPRLLLYRRKRLAAGCSNRTCNADAGTLRACLNWAVASGPVPRAPFWKFLVVTGFR
jgi:hypothetical protein